MHYDKSKENFGCDECWTTSAEDAWEAKAQFKREDPLIHESHFLIVILTCTKCTQRLILVFTEEIDWVDGEDPQYSTLMPLTQQEALDLNHLEDSLLEPELNSLAPNRRSLRCDFPKGVEKPNLYWASGISIGRHD